MSSAPLDPEQRARLAGAKLRALVRDNFGERTWASAALAGTAAVHDGTDGFVLASSVVDLGAALAWSARAELAGTLTILAEDSAEPAVLARRAACFDPAPAVYCVTGRTVVAAHPAPYTEPLPPETEALIAVAPLLDHGAEITVEWGVVAAEIAGLEVGRAVRQPDGGWALEVGVGRYDREAAAIMGKLRTPEDMVSSVAATVRALRRPEAEPHLLNRLARQRWLRCKVVAEPSLVGTTLLANREPPVPRTSLVDPAPAFAVGPKEIVAFSVGVELDVVAAAADARAREAALHGLPQGETSLELVIVAPQRDLYPVTELLASRVRGGCRLVAVEGDWPADLGDGRNA